MGNIILNNKFDFRTIIQVGTQNQFHSKLHNLLEGLEQRPNYCKKSDYIPINKYFQGFFKIDWCKFDIVRLFL